MFIGYVDESGFVGCAKNPKQPVQAMACFFPNVYGLHRTTADFQKILDFLRQNNIPLEELKAKDIYRGKGKWKKVDGQVRHEVFAGYLTWLANRPHKIILSLIDNNLFFDLIDLGHDLATQLRCPYIAAALHVALVIQRINQTISHNKGKTILIFDEQKDLEHKVEMLIAQLDQIIDTAYFVKSHHSYSIQTADMVVFVAQLHMQLHHYGLKESYKGEAQRINSWFAMIKDRLIPSSKVYPKAKNDICQFYRDIAPPHIPF